MAARRTREWEFDPGIEALNAPYTMASMAYFAQLGCADEARYEVLSFDVHKAWNWNRGENKGNGFANIRAAIRLTKSLLAQQQVMGDHEGSALMGWANRGPEFYDEELDGACASFCRHYVQFRQR